MYLFKNVTEIRKFHYVKNRIWGVQEANRLREVY